MGRKNLVTKGNHFPKLPRRIDVQNGERRLRRIEGLLGQMHEDGRVRADRIEQDRAPELARDLAQNVDAFCLETSEYRHLYAHLNARHRTHNCMATLPLNSAILARKSISAHL